MLPVALHLIGGGVVILTKLSLDQHPVLGETEMILQGPALRVEYDSLIFTVEDLIEAAACRTTVVPGWIFLTVLIVNN